MRMECLNRKILYRVMLTVHIFLVEGYQARKTVAIFDYLLLLILKPIIVLLISIFRRIVTAEVIRLINVAGLLIGLPIATTR